MNTILYFLFAQLICWGLMLAEINVMEAAWASMGIAIFWGIGKWIDAERELIKIKKEKV